MVHMHTLSDYCITPFSIIIHVCATKGCLLAMCHSPISVFPMTSLYCGFSLSVLWGYLSLRASSCCRVVGLNHWTLGPWIASDLGGWSYKYINKVKSQTENYRRFWYTLRAGGKINSWEGSNGINFELSNSTEGPSMADSKSFKGSSLQHVAAPQQ